MNIFVLLDDSEGFDGLDPPPNKFEFPDFPFPNSDCDDDAGEKKFEAGLKKIELLSPNGY
jgi:hypothetical protein